MPPRTTAEEPATVVSAAVTRPPVSDSAAPMVRPRETSRPTAVAARSAASWLSAPVPVLFGTVLFGTVLFGTVLIGTVLVDTVLFVIGGLRRRDRRRRAA